MARRDARVNQDVDLDEAAPRRRRQRPPRAVRKLKLIKPVSWIAGSAVLGGMVAAALIASG